MIMVNITILDITVIYLVVHTCSQKSNDSITIFKIIEY